MNIDSAIEILSTIVGLIYLYYEYKAHRLLWLMSIITPAISLLVYYNTGLYADFGINLYYIIAGIYGYIVWNFKDSKRRTTELPITHTPTTQYIPLTICTIIFYIAIAYILINYTDSNVPHWDAITTALSITAMWMLAHKYIEQWWVWVAVDAISVGLYYYKELYFYAALYLLYIIIAFKGYNNWKKIMSYDNNRPL